MRICKTVNDTIELPKIWNGRNTILKPVGSKINEEKKALSYNFCKLHTICTQPYQSLVPHQ